MDVNAFFPVFPDKLLRHINPQFLGNKPCHAGKPFSLVPILVSSLVKLDPRR
jgi:hypothetical protein